MATIGTVPKVPQAAKAESHLADLPTEILSELPWFLSNLADLYALIRTSRRFHLTCASTAAKLSPSPNTDNRLLLAGVARQLADWAVSNEENKHHLSTAFQHGSPDLLQLALSVPKLSLTDIRALHDAKVNTIEPVIATLKDECEKCGQGPYYKNHCLDIDTAVYDYITYCSLFHVDICNQLCGKDAAPKSLGPEMRRRWAENCLPEVVRKRRYRQTQYGNRRQRDLENLFRCHRTETAVLTALGTAAQEKLAKNGLGKPAEINPLITLLNFMQHQGLLTLGNVLQDGHFNTDQDEKWSLGMIDRFCRQIENGKVAVGDGRLPGSVRAGWVSLLIDLGWVVFG